MNILVNPEETFPISVKVAVQEGNPRKYYAAVVGDDAALKKFPEGLVPETYEFVFRPIDSKINSEIVDAAVEIVNSKVKISGAALRQARLYKTLKKWNLKDEDGGSLPVTEANMSALPSVVSQVLSDELDKLQEGV